MIVVCMRCERAFTSRALLHKGEADAPVVAPNRAAMPYEIVAHDQERERWRQHDGNVEVDRRAARRHVSHRARDAAVFEGDRSTLEDTVTLRCTLLDHSRRSMLMSVK